MAKCCTPDGRAICAFCVRIFGDDEYINTVNPDGGYGRDEVLICDPCLDDPKNAHVKQRLIDCGALKDG